MRRKAQVHMLPTDKPSLLRIDDGVLALGTDKLCQNTINYQYQHLYFTTDEEIKKGEWAIHNYGMGEEFVQYNKDYGNTCRKIVATTNPDLWTTSEKIGDRYAHYGSGIGKIDEDFIQAYVKAEGKITEVELEYEEVTNPNFNRNQGVSIHNPTYKLKLKLRNNGTVIIHPVQQKLYTREEVFDILVKSSLPHIDEHTEQYDIERLKQWFDKNYPE